MTYNEILKKSRMSITAHRVELLRVLTKARFPLSEKEIEDILRNECNRTTIYRNLSRLVDKGIVYRIAANGAVKYKFSGMGKNDLRYGEHVHFQCDKCHKVLCMHDLPVQSYSLPAGFTGRESQFLVVGICRECNNGDE